jgi:hypothetical protein
MLRRVVAILGNRLALQRQVTGEQLSHAGVADPVRGLHDRRREPARQLVFAARSRLEAPQALAQAIGNTLVEAEFEMQAVIGPRATPVAPVECIIAAKTDRHGDRQSAITGDEGDHSTTQSRRQTGETGGRESGVIAEPVESAGVECVQQRPFGGVDLIPVPCLDRKPALRDPSAFGADLAAFGRTEGSQIAIEVAAAGIEPVKLDVVTDQQPRVAQQVGFCLGSQRHMPRRSSATVGQRLGSLDQRLPYGCRVGPFGDQEASSGNRGVRQAAHQFRVVLAAELPVGRRPGPVIDEVAVRVALDVQRQQADDGAALVAGHQMTSCPARLRAIA